MSVRDEARTPRDFFDRVSAAHGPFELDAACSEENILAPNGIYREADALGVSWADRSGNFPVWLNPPYSNLAPWMAKARQEACRAKVVCLVPLDPSAGWWQESVRNYASQVIFVVGRLRFLRPDGRSFDFAGGGGGFRAPSALIVYNPLTNPQGWVSYSYINAVEEGTRPARRVLSLYGETRTLSGWAAKTGIPRTTISARLRRGWGPKRALAVHDQQEEARP